MIINTGENFRYIDGTGHFIQMIWAETRTVGCGMVSHVSREQPNKVTRLENLKWKFVNKTCFRYYACHYGPVGNYIGQQIYSPGSPCSRCPYQTQCSNTFQGLCQDNNYQKTNFRYKLSSKFEFKIRKNF